MNAQYHDMKELTLRGIILGALITVVFTASNIYLGLKVGLTFSTSIPAAVISMAVLSLFTKSNILENNMVQTQASAAGTLSSIVFILPALLIVGYWTEFPFWQTMLICTAGGFLGVIFTIPLRRTMVVNSPLPYPEGVAAAEVLKVGHSKKEEDKGGAKEIALGAGIAAVVKLLTEGFKFLTDEMSFWLVKGQAVFQLPVNYSLALVSAGYLMGIYAGVAMLLGVVLNWGVIVPLLGMNSPEMALATNKEEMISIASSLWNSKARLIGAGTIAIAAVWTLLTLIKPMWNGIKLSIKAIKDHDSGTNLDRTDLDMSGKSLLIVTLIALGLLFFVFYSFVQDASIPTGLAWGLVVLAVVAAFTIGFFVASACGYMAGLIGSSNSPISGIGIVSIVAVSSILFALSKLFTEVFSDKVNISFLMALAIFITAAVVAVGSIANDNLQDLKTGYLVKATPKNQQIALLIGCVVGAMVIAPVIEVLYHAYGLAGAAAPRPDMDIDSMLNAPQAGLMARLAEGIFTEKLDWPMFITGLGLGGVVVIVDAILGKMKSRLRIPALAIGMGIYLPASISVTIFIGALLRFILERHVLKKAPSHQKEKALQASERKGTLLAAGLIVGESLMGVLLAIAILVSVSTTGSDAPFALSGFFSWLTGDIKEYAGLALFVFICLFFYRRVGNVKG